MRARANIRALVRPKVPCWHGDFEFSYPRDRPYLGEQKGPGFTRTEKCRSLSLLRAESDVSCTVAKYLEILYRFRATSDIQGFRDRSDRIIRASNKINRKRIFVIVGVSSAK